MAQEAYGRQQIIEAIEGFLKDPYLSRAGLAQIGPDDGLFDLGVLDSLGVLEMIGFLEKSFGVSLGAEDLTWENISTINRLADLVQRRQRSACNR